MGRPEEKKRLGGPGHRCKGNVKIDIEVTGWVEMVWVQTGSVAGFCECSNESSVSLKCGVFVG